MSERAGSLGRAFASRLAALCLLCVPPFVAAQETAPPQEAPPAQEVLQRAEGGALKWDEFGRVGHCDMGARLDNFASVLLDNPTVTGYLVGYDPAKGSPGIAKRSIETQRDYIVYGRGIAAERLVAVAAGRYEGAELKTELWLVPPGAQPPVEAPDGDGGQPFSGKYATLWMEDDSSFAHEEEMGGPGSMWITRRAFADTLKRQPRSKAYLVAYADGDRAPGAWRRFASSEKLQLEGLGVESSRLEVVNGGRRKQSVVELWLAPEDAPPPVKAKKREKRLREAARIGAYSHANGKEGEDAGERRWMLDNLAEMLREDPQRVGCLVVFRDDAPPEFDEATGKTETPFDYVALAGEWRRELWERHGIEEHRVVLLVGSASGWVRSSVETWIVPKGVALPDPAGIVESREAEMNAADDSDDAEKP